MFTQALLIEPRISHNFFLYKYYYLHIYLALNLFFYEPFTFYDSYHNIDRMIPQKIDKI